MRTDQWLSLLIIALMMSAFVWGRYRYDVIAAGSLLVFILAVGYYITPALVGGADGQLISNLISFHMTKSNWSLAAAIAAMLLAAMDDVQALPDCTVMIGDTAYDMAAALAAGSVAELEAGDQVAAAGDVAGD